MREKTYHLYLNEEERSRVIQSLIELKNNLAAQGRYTDAVDDVLCKVLEAKKKKLKIINDAYCDRSMTRDYDREGLNAFFATLKEEDFEVVVVRSLNEITDDIYDLEEFVKTITDMGIWLYSLEVGPVPIIVSHAEDFGC